MKTIFLLFILSALALSSCTPTTNDAVKYNDSMIDEQIKIVKLFDSLEKCLDSNLTGQLLPVHKKLLKQIETSTEIINKVEDFDKSNDYKRNIKTLFEVYKDVAESEYNKIIEIYLLPDTLYTKEIEQKFNSYYESAYNKIKTQMEKFDKFQKGFSKKYGFELVDNKVE